MTSERNRECDTGRVQVNQGQNVKPLVKQPLESTTPRQRPWRTLEEYSNDPEFLEQVRREYAPGAEWWLDEPSRRSFLKTMGASFALAGLTGCGIQQPEETIVPYIETPENMIPGVPQYYATAMPQLGGAIGLLALSNDGRPTKIEGNPDHPISRGATDTYSQASVLGLYDPHRLRVVQRNNRISDWPEFLAEFNSRIEIHYGRQGEGLCLLTGEVLSPTLRSQIKKLLETLPKAKWFQYEPAASTSFAQASTAVFGQVVTPSYNFENADIIFSVADNFLAEGPQHVRYAREFASRRRVEADGKANMNRLYQVETTPSITGTKADHWLRLPPADVAAILVGVARKLGVEGISGINVNDSAIEKQARWVEVLSDDLKAAGSRGLVVVGATQPALLHGIAAAINQALGAVGTTVNYLPPVGQIEGVNPGTIYDLVQEIDAGKVDTLVLMGVNPVYDAPADLDFKSRLSRDKVPVAIYHGLHSDATAELCEWQLPAPHYLEEWSDTQAADGTISIVQPLIRPMYQSRSSHEILNLLLNQSAVSGYDTLRGYWDEKFGANSSQVWKQALHDGVVKDSAFAPVSVTFNASGISQLVGTLPTAEGNGITITFQTDPCLFDGRYSTNSWLQETPKPISKLTWSNAAWISPRTAKEIGVKTRDIIEVTSDGRSIEIPVWIQPGMADNVVTLALGQGRKVHGADPVGVDVYAIRTSKGLWQASGTVKAVSGKRALLPATQHHHLLEGRDLLRHGTIQEVQENPSKPAFVQGHHEHHGHHDDHSHDHDHDHDHDHGSDEDFYEKNRAKLVPGSDQPTFYPDMPYHGPQWGLTINLSACTGCNACVLACQSENNVPVVGGDQVARGREMHWLRIDSYFEGPVEDPDEILHQPVMCMHCEHAPCEPVCPVGATTHSQEGLNEMTYNRCIGTRYCSNNCPYKVRRFNFLDYHVEDKLLPVLQLKENPNVTVRSRGVMEKCTYCVQRISSARIRSKIEGREIKDGEVVTACQSACPTQAITFGNIADPHSAVAKTKLHPLNYGMLSELNTRPRTSYLAAVKNPNPALANAKTAAKEHA